MTSKAVIFDMDGVLLDSEPYYNQYLNERFLELDLAVTDDEYNGFVGMSSREIWSCLEESKGINLDIDDLLRREEERVYYIFSQAKLEPFPGIMDLLQALEALKVPMNVASSSAKSTIEIVIKKLNLNGYFRFLISGNEVSRGKPEPDIFLKSAQIHQTEAENCLVIEDSGNGVLAAKRAGMKCVGFISPNSGQQDLSKADLIIDNFNDESIGSILDLLNT